MSDLATSRGALRGLRGYLGLLLAYLYAPLAILVIFSFNDAVVPRFPLRGFTTRWYHQFLSNPELLASLRRSAVVAASSAAGAVALGLLASVVLVRRRFRGRSAFAALVLSPLVIPYLVFGVSLLILLKTVDRFLIDAFGVFVGEGLHAVVVGHAVVSLPYAVLILVPRLEKISVSLEEAALDLGANGWETFRRVTFPLLLPAVLSAYLVAVTISFDEVVIASFLVGTETTYPVYLFSQIRFPTLLPQMLAVAVVVLVATLAVVVGAELGRRVAERRLDLPEARA